MNSTSSVIGASASLLDPFASVIDPIPPVIVTPVLSHMQSSIDTLQTTDSHVSLLEKSMPLSNSMSDNTNSQLNMQSVSQQMPILPEPEQKDIIQEHNDTHLPRISEAFDTPMLNVVVDPIKSMETDIPVDPSMNRLEEVTLPKSDDSRSQEAMTANFETSKHSMSNDSTHIEMTNNGLTETMTQNDNAMQQAPEAEKSIVDPMSAYNTNLPIESVIGQDSQSQSMQFDQSSNHSQYSLPPGNGQTTVLGDNNQMQNPNAPYVPQMIPQHVYPPPLSHLAEKQMLQQQLSELYCIPATPEIHEKIKRLDDRLKLLQQHETNEQCLGGPQCVLLNPMMTVPMIESPQVSSTTGRGRSRGGSSKPRKPRQKKSDKQQSPGDGNVDTVDINSTIKSTDQLPVSEDFVTQGAGLAADDIINEMTDVHEEGSQEFGNELDTSTTVDGKKPKKSKSRSKKEGKEPKEPKERKKKDPSEPKKKSRSKRDKGEQSVPIEPTEDANISNTEGGEMNQSVDNVDDAEKETSLNDDTPDFDDIPVSKISVKSLQEEAAKKEVVDGESEQTDIETTPTPTPKSKRRSSGGNRSGSSRSRKRSSISRSGKKPARSRARVIVESDGEGDDLVTTPPPSPPVDSELDSSKRRSARNTQRKKYIDDVMLSISDEDADIISPIKSEKKKQSSEKVVETTETGDGASLSENKEITGKF